MSDYDDCDDYCDEELNELYEQLASVRYLAMMRGFAVRDVRGAHRKPCSECGKKDWWPGEYYVYDAANPWGTDKYCLDCAEWKLAENIEVEEERLLAGAAHAGEEDAESDDDDIEVVQVKDVHAIEAEKLEKAKRTGQLIDLRGDDGASARGKPTSPGHRERTERTERPVSSKRARV